MKSNKSDLKRWASLLPDDKLKWIVSDSPSQYTNEQLDAAIKELEFRQDI